MSILPKFIPHFAIIAPLFLAAARTHNFNWTPQAQPTWRALCQSLTTEAVLAHPDYKRPDCDGSGDGFGAALLQAHEDGERVIAYASRSLHDREKKWTATNLEAGAVIWALGTFRHYIDTANVCVRTDHAPLEYIRNNSSQCRRLERWALRLQEFRFEVQHRSSAQQEHVDCLSQAHLQLLPDEPRSVSTPRASTPALPSRPRSRRNCAHVDLGDAGLASTDEDADVEAYLTDTEDETPHNRLRPVHLAQFFRGGRNIALPPAVDRSSVHAQQQDPRCQEFRRLLGLPRSKWPPHIQPTPLRSCLVHDLLCFPIADAAPRVVLPAIFRRRAIHAHHLSYYGGHFGVTNTAARVACRYWWPRLRQDVDAYLRRCTFCLAHAGSPQKGEVAQSAYPYTV
ncbi:hypothetical protein ACSSS7_001394 [Eimeria intestinalis]